MEVKIQEQDGNMVAILSGRLDTAAVPNTEKAMGPLYECEKQDIIIDCTDLTYISSGGLRIFLSILKVAEKKGEHVYIKGVTDNVRASFAMTGFINIFEFK